MRIILPIMLLSLFLVGQVSGQQETVIITKASFSTDKSDEFAPAYYKNGLVFCSNRSSGVTEYSGADNKRVYKLYYADTVRKEKQSNPVLFSKDLKSRLNDGPATFNASNDTIYFSRNLVLGERLKNMTPARNKLGIFSAVQEGKKWEKISEMRFNNEWYNITTPCLSADGKTLFFASDKPEGFGGSDLYCSKWENGYWSDPVNLGPEINTGGNESYPFINGAGELYFSSDSLPGLGGKDIFVTKQNGGVWYTPIRLDPPINSEYDDFGIVTDLLMNEGYFSSGRGKTIDIYHFKSSTFHIWFSDKLKDNNYCFAISDSGLINIDTLKLKYVWRIESDGEIYSPDIQYCFPGPGKYDINLDISDKRTGSLIFRKLSSEVEIIDYDQPFINSIDNILVNEPVEFDGFDSYCPGFNITGYYWDFGDSTQGRGEKIVHSFEKAGEYDVRLGLTLQSQSKGILVKRAVSKRIMVFSDEMERAAYINSKPVVENELPDIRQYENASLSTNYSAEDIFKKDAVFEVEITSSLSPMDLNSTFFRNVPVKYQIRELFDPEAGTYSYIIDQQMSLMATYPAFTEILNAGFNDAVVKISEIKDPAEKELHILKKNYGILTDVYFDANNKLVTNAYLMLDQIGLLMNRYPDRKLEIGVHTDNTGNQAGMMSLSLTRARVIADYLTNRGIDNNRLSVKGHGGTRPVASNDVWYERRLNRRIDFILSK